MHSQRPNSATSSRRSPEQKRCFAGYPLGSSSLMRMQSRSSSTPRNSTPSREVKNRLRRNNHPFPRVFRVFASSPQFSPGFLPLLEINPTFMPFLNVSTTTSLKNRCLSSPAAISQSSLQIPKWIRTLAFLSEMERFQKSWKNREK